jgi:hypothetical protein
MMMHTGADTGLYAGMMDLDGKETMYSSKLRYNTWEKFQWMSRKDGHFSLKCYNGYYAAFKPGTVQLTCDGSWSDAAQLYIERAEIRGVWAAGVVQFPHHPVLGDKHRWYKIH